MKGLSPTALQKTTSFAAAIEPVSAVASAQSRTTCPISATAFMLMPARDEPMFTEEQTTPVVLSASGMERMRRLSAAVPPFSTRAE